MIDFGRIVAVKGRHFDRYLIEVVMPQRREVATLVLAQLLREWTPESALDVNKTISTAFAVADEFVLQDGPTLEAKFNDYFSRYMERGKIDEILKAQMEAAHDWSG